MANQSIRKQKLICLPQSENRFGAELYRLRRAAGATQRDMARLSGLARGYYSQLENSKRPPPPPHTLELIVRALCLSELESHRLHFLAEKERWQLLALPGNFPAELVEPLWELVTRASRLPISRLHRVANLLGKEFEM